MDKKILAIYISGAVIAVIMIITTILLILGMRNKPVSICSTLLTNDMAQPLLEDYCGIDDKEASKYVEVKDIKSAYLGLLNSDFDVLLTSEIDDETIKWLKLNGVEVKSELIAKDALVFVNNLDNPVKDLSVKEVKGIYSGQYKDWNEVGGENGEIIAYPPIDLSEEAYMLQHFMGNKAIVLPKYRLKDSTLDKLKEATSEFLDTKTRAMFYTTYHNMKNNENNDLRILTLEDIEVSEKTIKSEVYPGTAKIYAIIRADTLENSQTRKFVEYIRTQKGQDVIKQCGYVNLVVE